MTTKLATVTDEVANIVRQILDEKFGGRHRVRPD